MRTLLIALILIPATGCLAAEDGREYGWWYLGGGISLNNVFAVSGSGLGETSERGDADTGFVLNVGYRFGPYTAVEIGYVDGGTAAFETVTTQACYGTPCLVHARQRTTAFEANVVLLLPFRNIWELYFKAGAATWDASADQVLAPLTPGMTGSATVSADGTDLLMGIGAGVHIGQKMHARLEYHAFRTEDDLLALGPGREARFDLVSLELHWRF